MKNIFISSTFRDMQAERDMVQERVLPALREEARKYGDNVGVIDLRWGVDTSTLESEEGAAKVLKVCLDEIDRSHPYMLIFIGERYGWIPEGKLIERAVRGREDKYITEDYAKSVTALEVEYGALSEKYGELNHCVVCFREPVVHMLEDADKALYADPTEEGKRKLEALKARIKRDLGEDDRLINYSGTWDKSARQLVNFTSNGQPLEKVLTDCFIEMFRDDWKEYEALRWQDKEQLAFRALMESKLCSFVGREALLEEYYQSAVNGTCPIVLQGEVGSGKTAILCKVVERLQKEGKNVFTFFSGAGSMSTNAESLVKQMVYYMENLLGIKEHFGDEGNTKGKTDDVVEKMVQANEKRVTYDDWMEQLEDLCAGLPEGQKVYFCIDAMDQLFRDEHVEKLDFFARGKNAQVIASCTDEFELPMEAMVKREVKQIPALREADAKTVAEGILAFYSRNAYAAMEEEILKKKSRGNPLYISMLIQRLNMMDTEELQSAMTEEEIVSLGTGLIREMPESTEEAMVAVIRNGIEKISESEELLYEVLEYLAISRNGLRMSDLQGIFTSKGSVLPVLDFTLLQKYLDSFFYVHEDDRIDFTHRAIRQGLLKGLTDREAKEEAIKEHLKTLDTADGLRIREGMYFARIRSDEVFAKALIEQAYLGWKEELAKAIRNEAVKDGGKFCCGLIEKETQEDAIVLHFFERELTGQQGDAKEEMMARLAMAEAMVTCYETIHEKNGNESSLLGLANCYSNLGRIFYALGRSRDAFLHYVKMFECLKQLQESGETESSLYGANDKGMLVLRAYCFRMMGKTLKDLGNEKEASFCYEKMLGCMEQVKENDVSEASLLELIAIYDNMGSALVALGQAQEGVLYYEKALKCAEQFYKENGSSSSLRVLSNSYNTIGNAFMELNDAREALAYFEKSLQCDEQLYKKNQNIPSLRNLSSAYKKMGNVLMGLGYNQEALSYCEKTLKIDEEMYKRGERELRLRELSVSYSMMGHVCHRLGQLQEALLYYERALTGTEVLLEKRGNESNLRDASVNYNNIIGLLQVLGRAGETLPYYEKMLDCLERLYAKTGSESSLRDLSIYYNNMGSVYIDLGQSEEALKCLEKAMRGREELYSLEPNDSNLNGLSVACNNYGYILCELGRTEEAYEYFGRALVSMDEIYRKNPTPNIQRDLVVRWRNMAYVLLEMNRLPEAIAYSNKAVASDLELFLQDSTVQAMENVVKSMSRYADIILADNQTEKAFGVYTEALEYCKSVCEKNDSVANLRSYVSILKGMYLCLHKSEQAAEAEKYLLLAKEEAKKLYERSGIEKDKKVLEELLGY